MHVRMRAAAVVVVLVLEYLILHLSLARSYDGQVLTRLPPAWRWVLWNAQALVAGVSLSMTAAAIYWGSALREKLVSLSSAGRPAVGWLGFHLALFTGLTLVSWRAFSSEELQGWESHLLLGVWIACGVLQLYSLLRGLFGRHVLRADKQLLRVLALALSAALVARGIADRALPLWANLGPITLAASTWVLRLFCPLPVRADPRTLSLAVGDFEVEVARACSGVQGIALIGAFMVGYLLRFRALYRFPNALWLVPCAMGLAWAANALRIAALVALGAFVDPEVASGAFHSSAGWIFFCILSIAIAGMSSRSAVFTKHSQAEHEENPTAAYLLPFLALLGTGMLTAAFANGLDPLYGVRLLVVPYVLYRYRNSYRSIELEIAWQPAVLGVLVFAMWLALPPPVNEAQVALFGQRFAELGSVGKLSWVSARLLGGVILVPVVEELAFRGYLQRRLIHEDFCEVPLRRFGWVSFVASSVVFGVLHDNWIAGSLAGAAFSLAAYWRGRLIDAIVAHAVCNGILGAWVLIFERWDLW